MEVIKQVSFRKRSFGAHSEWNPRVISCFVRKQSIQEVQGRDGSWKNSANFPRAANVDENLRVKVSTVCRPCPSDSFACRRRSRDWMISDQIYSAIDINQLYRVAAVRPPSTGIDAPVSIWAFDESRKTMHSAISSG